MPGKATSDPELELTLLELDILHLYHCAYLDRGFPATSEFRVKSRENTGAGRWTKLEHAGGLMVSDGMLCAGKYCYFKMDGLPSGATYCVYVLNNRVVQLGITVNGDHYWDGLEREYEIMDPETALSLK